MVHIVKKGYELIIVHGNGPQVGNILIQMEEAVTKIPPFSLDVCDAMTEGSMGVMLEKSLINELRRNSLDKEVATLITQVIVDKDDPAFQNPTKPVGPFYTKYRGQMLAREKKWTMVEDAGRGYRKVVPSPKPIDVVSKWIIRDLVEAGRIVIAAGGGGIPTIINGRGLFKGVEAGIYTKEEAREKLDYFTGRIFFNAIVEDTRTKQRTSGISSAPLKTYAKGKMIEDEFASVKAHNKAVRNSIEMLMTAEAKATLLMIAMKQGYKPTKLEKLTEIVTKQPASEKQKSEIEFLLVEKGMSIAEAEAKLSEKFNREIKIDFSTMTAKQAAWIIKELATS